MKQWFSRLRYQTTKDRDPWRWETNEVAIRLHPANCPLTAWRRSADTAQEEGAQVEPGGLLELKR